VTRLRVHWRMIEAGDSGVQPTDGAAGVRASAYPIVEAQVRFCRLAEDRGIDSVLVNFHYYEPDPFLLASAVGARTERMRFMLAYRSGLMSPTMFVQQTNTLAALIDGRLSFNIVAGFSPTEQRMYGDQLGHDNRYARTAEFLTVCQALWRREKPVDFAGEYYQIDQGWVETPFLAPDRQVPELYIGGRSEQAQSLTADQGSCWLTFAEAPDQLRPEVARITAAGKQVGVRGTVVCRPTHREAVDRAHQLAAEVEAPAELRYTKSGSDSVMFQHMTALAKNDDWLTPYLWTGLMRPTAWPPSRWWATRTRSPRRCWTTAGSA
jgi:alkanesulfonate monooxygenase